MNRENKKAMWLTEADLPGKRLPVGILPCLMAIMAYTVLTLTVSAFTGSREICDPAWAAAGGVIVCLIWILFENLRMKQWFVPGMLAVMLLMLLVGRAWLAEGFRLFWNQMSVIWTAGTGLVLKQWQTQLPGLERLCLVLFSLSWAVAAGMVCCLIARWKPILLSVLVPLVTLIGMMLFRTQQPLGWISVAFLAGFFLYLGSGWTRKGETSAFLTWILCGSAAMLVLIAASLPGIENWTAQYSDALRQSIHDKKYETQYTTLPEGKLDTVTEESTSEQPALVVTMTHPETMYLRGFTGASFDGEHWTEQDTEVLTKNRELLYWINQYEFHPLSQFEAALLDEEYEENHITVQNISACSRYRYVPYSLSQFKAVPEDLRTDSLMADGERVHFYSVVMAADSKLWPILENLQNSEEQTTLDYRKAESAYRAYVTEHYLNVPEESIAVLGTVWDEAAENFGGKENLTPQTAQLCVRQILDRIAEGDTLQWQEQLPASGTVFQDATVAVLTLRYFGFPARYAEGYIISEELIADAKPDTAFQVGSTCAGAWAEVYQDGIGWIPAELTYGTASSSAEPEPEDTQSSQDSNSNDGFSGMDEESGNGFIKEGQELEELEELENQQEQEEQQQNFTIQLPESLLKILLGLLLSMLLVLLIILIRYWVLIRKKEKKFRDDRVNDAVAWVYADAAQILTVLGFERRNGSMTQLLGPVSEHLGQEYGSELEEMTRLNAKAMFSSKALTEEQRTRMLQFRMTTVAQLKLHTKWYRRLLLKWIHCLY